jgi:hypothetical protein
MLERRMAASPVDGLIVYPEGASPAAPALAPRRPIRTQLEEICRRARQSGK